jgi:cytochrome c-type biogenesis protein CcmH/NrfG
MTVTVPQASSMASNPGTGGSMEAATATLAARLAAKGGTDEDWNLLAQSYDFLGRTDDAKLARSTSCRRSAPCRTPWQQRRRSAHPPARPG